MPDFLGFDRVTSNSRELRFNLDRRRIEARLYRAQREISSGKRVNVPSDDPVAAGRAFAIERIREDNKQFVRNIQFGTNRLQISDESLGDVNQIANRALEILLQQSQSTFDRTTRAQAAIEVDRLFDEAVSIANRKFGDEFLFAGQNVSVQPFQGVGEFVRYLGNDVELRTRIANGTDAAVSITGRGAFGALSAQVTGDVNLDPNMDGATKLADLSGGRGVGRGSIRVTSGGVTSIIDLSDADDVQDVLDRLVASAAVAAAVVDPVTGDRLVVTGVGATVQIEEVDSTTATDLGIRTVGAVASPLTGLDVNPAVTGKTAVANLLNGAGLTGPPTAITITNGNDTAVVDLSAATTFEDILNTINSAGVNVFARINATADGIDVVSNLQGARLTISEAGGTTAAELGLLLDISEQELNDLNNGLGVVTVPGLDFRITLAAGTTIDIDIDPSTVRTVQDVLDLINNDPENPGTLVADFVPGTNQLRLTDASGPGTLSVTPLNGSFAAQNLGIQQTVAGGGPIVLTGTDLSPAGVRTESLFTVLNELRNALRANSSQRLSALGDDLQRAQDLLNEARAEIGGRVRRLDQTRSRHDEEEARLAVLLSDLTDVDAAEAITRLQQDQTLLEATLRSTAIIARTSLFDYI
ncbi:MAG: flagellar hook-associated protein FlgL [Planctomycetes bacterium]|nr:flagellar hook-associated protein FlgL [Planctomycetota bacterium]